MNATADQDQEQLKLLSIFHYVVGGIAALFAMFPILHLIMGLVLIFAPQAMDSHGDAPPTFIGWFFVIFAGAFICAGWLLAILIIIIAARFLARRKHHLFCLVVAGIECVFMPFGTVLGVFTIIVLSRDSVKQMFAERQLRRQDVM